MSVGSSLLRGTGHSWIQPSQTQQAWASCPSPALLPGLGGLGGPPIKPGNHSHQGGRALSPTSRGRLLVWGCAYGWDGGGGRRTARSLAGVHSHLLVCCLSPAHYPQLSWEMIRETGCLDSGLLVTSLRRSLLLWLRGQHVTQSCLLPFSTARCPPRRLRGSGLALPALGHRWLYHPGMLFREEGGQSGRETYLLPRKRGGRRPVAEGRGELRGPGAQR